VARAKPAALVVADLPIHTYPDPATALDTARRLTEAGADAVKLEGGLDQLGQVRAILAAGIPVLGHLGMLPQRVLEEGGYHKKGKTPEQAADLLAGARALAAAGVFAIVLESVIPATARAITAAVPVPTIGIGCGHATCDGEVAVVTDVTGAFPWFVPPFAKPAADLAAETTRAVQAYRQRVRETRREPA
jgi:3-methyl-2-oxobutanoate hydroxymethyltransferase